MRHTPLKRKGRLRVVGDSDSREVKDDIQALLRLCAIARDGGCVLRHYPEAGACGGRTNAGELILQAEHLNGRRHSISYADMRNIVCLCKHHHIDWKPENSRVYWQLIERHIGPERVAWLNRVQNDKRPYRFYLADWKLARLVLERELQQLQRATLAA